MESLEQIGIKAKKASRYLAKLGIDEKNKALEAVADALTANAESIIAANEKDLVNAKANGMKPALIDRLTLDIKRINAMADGIRVLTGLEDPIGEVTGMKKRPNGLMIGQKRVPLGVIGIIYEARPNVTADAFGLCFKTGNVVILKGGSDAIHSNEAIVKCIRETLKANDITENAIQLIQDTSRETAAEFMKMNEYVDVLIPRGSGRLIQSVLENSRIPVIETGTGNCHVYVDKDAQKVTILEPGKEYERDDGSKAVGYNAKVVYDISQTSAKDRQQPQEAKTMRELVSAMIDASPVNFQPVEELELPAFYDSSQQTIFIRTCLNEEQLFVSMAKEVSAAVFDFKHSESRDASDFKSFCVAYMVSSRYGVDTKGFSFGKLPKEYDGMDVQAFKGELGSMRDVLGEIQSDMYKSMEKNKPPKSKEQER